MPNPSQLAHRVTRSTALPYKSNLSPVSTEACFVTGSQDLLTSIAGYCERRPGFASNLETTPTTFNNLQRLFSWNRFDGTFIEMACDVNSSNQAVVYKRVIGTDSSFVSVYTDTGSATPFDFCVSNNQVYFSNGHVSKKWDPTNGVSNWGIAVGSVNNASGPNLAGNGASGSPGNLPWTNPNNVTSTINYATDTITGPVGTDALNATQFGFSLPSTTTILGIQVTVEAFVSANIGSNAVLNAYILKAGNFLTPPKGVTITNTGVQTFTFGGTSDLWGTTWTYNDINQTNFGVEIQGLVLSGDTLAFNVRNVNFTVYGLGGPSVSVSGSAGSMSATTGYQYVFCYGNSNTGHVSSPTPASASTGAFTNKLNVQVSLTKSNDAQVNQIRVYRSTDAIAAGQTAPAFFEIPTSPYSNTTQNITDNAADTALSVNSIAPIFGFNDPPTPFQQPVYAMGRIWGYAGSKVYFSSLEENITGVPEESFVSGVAANFWAFDQGVTGLAVAGSDLNQTVLVFCGGKIYGIRGNTLDTQRRFQIANRRGCRNQNCITSLGGMVAWLDSSSQIWTTNGETLEELSVDIRPDLAGGSPVGASMTFHAAGKYHWLVAAFPTLMLVYDLDLDQWMPPWNISSKYVFSGETSAGTYDLMLSTGTKALKLSTTAHNDNGVSYTPIAKVANMATVPDFGTRFSVGSQGMYDEPSKTGVAWYFQVDTNNVTLADVLYTPNDDPQNSTTAYTSIFNLKTTPETAWNRANGKNLVQNVFGMNGPPSRWISFQVKGATADDALKMYDWFMAYEQRR